MPFSIRREFPIFLLLFFCLVIGLLIFKDYGLSWDEPLYYDYGRASQYAYSISARLDGTYDPQKTFGASPGDHVTRGPAYLLIGGLIERILESTGLDVASAWHLTNFVTYLFGLAVFYGLLRLWLDPTPAALSTAFYAWQPVLWNHAFINPKDSPFSIFFLVSMALGFRMIDRWQDNKKEIFKSTILPAIFLGIATSIRFIAPYTVGLLFFYFLLTQNWRRIWGFIPYGVVAVLVMIALWPFLWSNPIEKFLFTLQAMSNPSADLKILFMGNEYPAYDLPRRYFPILLATSLTEPTWLLFLMGLWSALRTKWRQKMDRAKLATILLWFVLAITLLVGVNPPNSDGYRHYLFILPPVFVFVGFGINQIIKQLKNKWLRSITLALILLPAIYGNVTLHPYQYAYYNTFIGGTQSAAREYETDYWLTCYKETMEDFNQKAPLNAVVFVRREHYIAAYYARDDLIVKDFRTERSQARVGDYLLINSRTNQDIKTFRDSPVLLSVGRNGATFCVIKQIQQTDLITH